VFRRIFQRVRTFGKSETGPTSVEYAILLALLLAVYLATLTTIGRNNWSVFNRAARSLGARSTGT
jgi:pilus assembly protein Flp/PilA